MKKSMSTFAVLVLLLLFSCSKSTSPVNASLSEELVIASFSVRTPPAWEWEQDQGIDTFIGRIFNDDQTIYFDQGYLSFGSLDLVEKSERTISFERLTINGVPAIIEKENTQEGENSGAVRLSVYLDAGDKERLNRLYIFDPVDEETIRAIFKSHRFTEN